MNRAPCRPCFLLPLAGLLAILPGVAAAAALSEPSIFAPGVISGPAKEDSAAFSPDGATVYFDRARWPNAFILESRREGNRWSTPRIAPFSGEWLDHDPTVAPDGSFLVFASNRPAVRGGAIVREGGNLWRVDRRGSGWGTPVRLPDAINASPKTYAPSIAADGSLYYQQADAATGEFHLFRAPYRDGTWGTPERLHFDAPTTHELDPAIAPDQSFLVFDADDPAHPDHDRLVIALRNRNGWGRPVDLGDAVNARGNPWGAHLGPDGRTLYFSSTRGESPAFPRTHAQAAADLVRLGDWDNGNENIWKVSLAPVLDADATAAASGVRPRSGR